MDIYRVDQRVAIDLNLDRIKVNDKVLMGTILDIRTDNRRLPGTLVHPMLIVVKGDDGEEYSTIKYGNTLSPYNLTTLNTFQHYIVNRFDEIKKELDVLGEIKALYEQQMNYRVMNGMSHKSVYEDYLNHYMPIFDSLRESNNAMEYLSREILPKFFFKPKNIIIIHNDDSDNNSGKNDGNNDDNDDDINP